jgi:hypothetical protein
MTSHITNTTIEDPGAAGDHTEEGHMRDTATTVERIAPSPPATPCEREGCDRPSIDRGLCPRHLADVIALELAALSRDDRRGELVRIAGTFGYPGIEAGAVTIPATQRDWISFAATAPIPALRAAVDGLIAVRDARMKEAA